MTDLARLEGGHGMQKYLLKQEDTILLVLNVQERLFEAMEPCYRDVFLKNTSILIHTAKALDIPILVSEQLPARFGRTVDEIEHMIQDLPRLQKLSFSCWREGQIRAGIKKTMRKTVVVTGIEAHVCVLQTVMDLLHIGYHAVVAPDAVCSRFANHRITAINTMNQAGAVIYPAESIVFMLMDKTDAPFYEDTLSLLNWDIPSGSCKKEAVNG